MSSGQFCYIYVVFLLLIKFTASSALVCFILEDRSLETYNDTTHVCKNGVLQEVSSLQPAPGADITQPPPESTKQWRTRRPRPRPPTTAAVAITTTVRPTTYWIGPIITKSTPPPTTPPKSTHTVNFMCTDGLLLINCSNAYYCSASADFMCCGYEPYFPEYDTCCAQTPTHAMVHSGKPERNYVCCRSFNYTTVYPRDPKTIPCVHPAWNDRLDSPPTLKKDMVTGKLCRQLKKSGVVLKVLRFDESTKQYSAKITRSFQSRGDKSRRRQNARKSGVDAKRRIHLKMDAYSPKTLTRRHFLLTGIEILHGEPVYLKPDIEIFALKKKSKSVKRKINKLRKWCKHLSVVM